MARRVPPPVGDPEARAFRIVEEYLAQDPSFRVRRVVRYAEGGLAFIHVASQSGSGLSANFAVDPNGEESSVEAADQAFAEAHRRSWGQIGLETAELVAQAPRQARRILLFPRLDLMTEAEAATWAASLDSEAVRLEGMPAFELHVDPDELDQLRSEPRVARVVDATPSVAEHAGVSWASWSWVSPQIPSNVLTTSSDLNFNAVGDYGDNVKVGLVEAASGCRFSSSHEAFQFRTGLTYQTNVTHSCTTNQGCENACTTDAAYCGGGVCESSHLTQVASRILSSEDGSPYHAAKAHLLVANSLPVVTFGGKRVVNITAGALAAAYNWLDQNGVRIVNESYVSTAAGFNVRSVVSDYYARWSGMLFVQAAGNRTGFESSSTFPIQCAGYGSLCVGSLFWNKNPSLMASPRDRTQWRLSIGSRWQNTAGFELEKPDLLAEGDTCTAAVPGTASTWSFESGTSGAAPVVTGLAAMLADRCSGASVAQSPLWYRSVLRTNGAFGPHGSDEAANLPTPLGGGAAYPATCPPSPVPAYPMTYLGCDHKAGAGPVDSTYLGFQRACELWPAGQFAPPNPLYLCSNPPCAAQGSGVLTPTSGWTSLDAHLITNSIGRQYAKSHEAGDAGAPDVGPQPPLGQAPNVKWHLLRRINGLGQGTRIRATFSYHSCPAGVMASPSTLSLAANFELVLVGQRSGASQSEWLAVSEGLHETNEGFDIKLPAAFTWVELRVVGPGGLSWPWSSTGTGSGNSSEPYHWSLMYGGG